MLKVGSVIDGKYKILNVIGRGGMSVVYLAMNERANKFWAVKEIVKSDSLRFSLDRKELELMKRLRHPCIPAIVDVIDRREAVLIVMDYVEGLPLDSLLARQGAQPQEKVLEWAKQLCGALSYLHSRRPPVIYRDLKPANVIERPDGTVALIDFGAAREYKPESLGDTVSLGTFGYAAPEQYERTGQSDARTDIYCLGVMMFQLLTGESPHRLRPIREYRPSLSAGLEAVLVKCTQLRKEERYQSCAELLYALEHYQEQDRTYREKQKRKVGIFAACFLGSALLGAAAGLFLGKETQIRKTNYEAYMLAARNSVDKNEEIENYGRAASLDPAREEAWLGLLREGFLDDSFLTAKESRELRAALIRYTDEGKTYEAVFQENEKGYARFAYEAGIAYFYKFEEKENKKNAAGYFRIAAESEALEEGQRKRARCLGLISDYYSRIGMVDEAGDAFVSYRDYWDDLTELLEGNLVEEDNERTALVMYREMAGQIVSRGARFRDAGVKKEEMLAQLVRIEESLDKDFTRMDEGMQELVRRETEEVRQAAAQAKRIVQSVFAGEEN